MTDRVWLLAAGVALFGTRWQAPLARAIDRSRNHVVRCATGARALPEADAAAIRALLAERRVTLDQIVGGADAPDTV